MPQSEVPTTINVNGEEMDISALPDDRRAVFIAEYEQMTREIEHNMIAVRASMADLQRRGLMDAEGNLINPPALDEPYVRPTDRRARRSLL